MGPFLLSGLMIGPILGSGIIILPPLVHSIAGNWAIVAWLLIVCTSFVFASIFSQLAVLYPGNAGVALAIEEAFGLRIKILTSFYLVGAVLFGPVAVMLTMTEYLHLSSTHAVFTLAAAFTVGCSLLLLCQIQWVGKVALVLSTLAATTLFLGGLVTLLFHRTPELHFSSFSGPTFGYSLLLLFWTIVGWEVVGNYSADVRCPEKTIGRATRISAIVIGIVTLTVASAIQYIEPQLIAGNNLTVTSIITPLFGEVSAVIMATLTCALCITTYLLFVGGVARLISSLATDGHLPSTLALRTKSRAPVGAIVFLTTLHILVLSVVCLGYARVEDLVAIADGFFIANACIGLLAACKLLESKSVKGGAGALAVLFTVIFLQGDTMVILLISAMALFFSPLPRLLRQEKSS